MSEYNPNDRRLTGVNRAVFLASHPEAKGLLTPGARPPAGPLLRPVLDGIVPPGYSFVNDPSKILTVLGPLVRSEILRHYRPESCIASTKAAGMVLDALGIPWQPMAVMVRLFNPIFMQLWRERHALPSPEEQPEWIAQGARMLEVGHNDAAEDGVIDNSWVGHLVLRVMGGWLWDTSLDQFSVPDHGLALAPLVMPIGYEFPAGTKALRVKVPGGGLLTYQARPHSVGYARARDWTANPDNMAVGKVVLDRLVFLLTTATGLNVDVQSLIGRDQSENDGRN